MLQDEPEAAGVIAQRLVQDGVDVRTNAAVQRVVKTSNGVWLSFGDDTRVEVSAVLVCVVRRPHVEGLGLVEASVEHGRGGIQVNKHLRASRANIYAAGDCADGYRFTYYAGYQDFMAVRKALLPFNKKSVLERVPWATFTDPEVAHVGLTEEQARCRHGDQVAAETWPMTKTDRWITEGDWDS